MTMMQQNGSFSTELAEEWVTTSNAFLSFEPNSSEEQIFSNPLCEQQELSEASSDFFTLSLNPLYREYLIPEEYLQQQPQQPSSSFPTSSPSTQQQAANVNYEVIEISPSLSKSHSPSPNTLSPLSATLASSYASSPTISASPVSESAFSAITPSLPITPLFQQRQVADIEEINEIEEDLFETFNPLFQGDHQNSIFPNGWCEADVDRLINAIKQSVYLGPHCVQLEPEDNLSFAGVVGDKLKACMHGEAMLNALLSGSCLHPEALTAALQPSTTVQTAIFQSISLSAFIVEGVVDESSTSSSNNSSSPSSSISIDEKLCTLTREDARIILQQLVEKRALVTLPYHPFGHEFNEHKYYRYIEDDLAAYYEDVINVKSKPGTSDETSPIATYLVMRKIEEHMSTLLEKYVDYEDGYVDYRSITNSEVFRNIILLSPKLRKIQVSVLGAAKKSFFINLYNMMALHALLIRGCDSTMKARETFSMTNFYFLEHHKICLDDILHGVLRKQRALPSKLHIEEYTDEDVPFDPRIHFVISNGTAFCALPRAVTFENCEAAIEEATRQFVNSETDIVETFDVKQITLSSIFRDYGQDFGPSILSSIAFVGKYLPPERRGIIERWLQSENIKSVDEVLAWSLEEHISFFAAKGSNPLKFKITFREHEWTSQRKGTKAYYKKKESATPSAASEPASVATPPTPSAIPVPAGLPQVTPEILQRKKKFPLPVVKETPVLLGFFRQFCNNEFSSENLQFYDMYLQYVALTSIEERFEKAQLLYDNFLSTKAETEVNVSRKKVKAVEELLNNARKERQASESTEILEKFTPELFDSLMAEVDLVIADSYARFCVSELYQDMIEDVFIKPQIQEKTTGKRRTSLKLSLKSIIGGSTNTNTNPSPLVTPDKSLNPQPSPRSASVIQNSPSVVSKLAAIKSRSTFTSPRPPTTKTSPRNESASNHLLSPTSLNHKSHSDSQLLSASFSPRVEDKSSSASTSPVIPFDISKEHTETVVIAINEKQQDDVKSISVPISIEVPEPIPNPKVKLEVAPSVQVPEKLQEQTKKELTAPVQQKTPTPLSLPSEVEVIKVETVAVATLKPLASPRDVGKTNPLPSPRQEVQKPSFLPKLDFSTATPAPTTAMSARGTISTERLVKPSQLLKRSNSADGAEVITPPTKPAIDTTTPSTFAASAGSTIAASVAGTHNKVSARLSQRIAMFQIPKEEALPQPRTAELDRLRTRSIVSTVKGSNSATTPTSEKK